MVAPTLNVEEYQYSDTGLVINANNVALPFFDITSVQGLDSAPPRTSMTDHEGFDGGFVDSLFESIRTVVVEGVIYASTTNMETYLDSLKANFAQDNTNKPFYFQTDAGQRMVFGKAQGLRYNKDQLRRLGMCNAQVQILCEDPRIYTPGLVTGQVALLSGSISGRGYNKSFNFGYGAPVTQGNLNILLAGNRTSPGTLRIDGPVVNPSIINDTTGDEFDFNITLNTGDYITVNLANRSVTLNGSQNIRSSMTITGHWFLFQPGNNSFRILGTQSPPTPAALLTASAYSAWR